jgi:hypothetical protein
MRTVLVVVVVAVVAAASGRAAAEDASTVEASATAQVQLRIEPRADAELAGGVSPGQPLRARLEAVNGYRWVRAPDGTSGWAPEDTIDLHPASAAAEPPPATKPSHGADLRPRVAYAATPEQLLSLVASDVEARRAAEDLVSRAEASNASMWATVVIGAATLFVASLSNPSSQDEVDRVRTLNRVGFGVLALGPILGWAAKPSRADITEAAQVWNLRHPETPIYAP